ncbi:F0F1 ATP synthase subunit gamma [Pseudoclavibacter sp. RFBJ3]|uniref:F0F1 ATP synthase subunit gamma n=1 Tax=unclassified Pseudoclavibacter TaxID=2615177 RepID=UPI000CE8033E|nr:MULTISPECIES: F0F1 ATP synthase subunit gamma [unclassified Pseudoclavibacter]MBF4549594.1 F0F1 ATP synthase subunit gamma [Pseudoclavibacter sp. VKM Ac-2888]PPF39864.1 F0F1 ATP synthase subunit gamma [Pseudoclavibacter sp. AY1H1]PPF76077.1 F0F1 ATP synthase subunit gamma [Pseudoclavibacter sp. Z016]PPF84828.1 F0F1 ATP synthase subunit gamma [Pseudoclavibacter sp. RFBJ5]PPF93831.1 F0F1 ATP synthase subunit gamma [Pseudoclavibacter sp. RFBJ3]
MGAQLRVYRQKIKSAQTMKKVTRAMELIATSRITKARKRMAESNPYAQAITEAVSAVASYTDIDHILVTEREEVRRVAVVVFTSDRGLNGAFSSSVLREAEGLTNTLEAEGKEVVHYLVGRKAVGYFAFRKRASEKQWTGATDLPVFQTAKELGEALVERFTIPFEEGGVEEIHYVYNRFQSMVTQTPTVVRLLPLEVVDSEDVAEADEAPLLPLYEFEPDAETVLHALLPDYIQARLFNAMLHSAASEHAARQRAMSAASDNADTLVRDYTRLANNARQAEITQQISEIVGGADALATA